MTEAQLTRAAYFASQRLPYRLREDARQEAVVGMLQAMARFDPTKGASESTFASHSARGAVLEWSRRCDPLTRRHRDSVKAGTSADVEFVPLIEALTVRSGDVSPFDCALHNEVRAAMASLTPDEAEVLTRIFWCEQTFRETAEAMRYSRDWICRLRVRAIRKMKAHFGRTT